MYGEKFNAHPVDELIDAETYNAQNHKNYKLGGFFVIIIHIENPHNTENIVVYYRNGK